MTSTRPRDSLILHPLARTACDALLALGPGVGPFGAARAVRDGQGFLLFAGFGWLFSDQAEVPVLLEQGLGSAEIERAAWAEVIAVAHLLALPPASRQAFARAVAAAAPAPVLAELQIVTGRDPRPLQRALRVPPRARETPETPFARALARYREGAP